MSRIIWIVSMLTTSISLAFAAPEPEISDAEMPDALKHMVSAPDIDFVNLRDPFESYLELVASRGRSSLSARKLRMNDRKREYLEGFDLSSLKLVAIFSMGGERVGMVQDAATKGYIVRRGSYLGKNSGHIEKITDDTVFLVEQVIDPAGEVTDRQVSLTLREVNE